MPVLLILLLAAAVEITVLVLVGDAIGVLSTIGLLIIASLVGAWLLRREGTRALRALQDAALHRRPPHQELTDGVLIAMAGVLVVLPGFVSDAVALLLLLPPTRALLRRRLLRSAQLRAGAVTWQPGPRTGPSTGQVIDGDVIDGEVIDDRTHG